MEVGIVVHLIQTYESGAGDFSVEMDNLKSSGAQLFLIQGGEFDVWGILQSANNLNMLNSNFSYILDNEFNFDLIMAYNELKKVPSAFDISGIWQVQSPPPPEYDPIYRNLTDRWASLFNNGNSLQINQNCPSFTTADVNSHAPSEGVNGCFPNTDIWAGSMPSVYKALGYPPPLNPLA